MDNDYTSGGGPSRKARASRLWDNTCQVATSVELQRPSRFSRVMRSMDLRSSLLQAVTAEQQPQHQSLTRVTSDLSLKV